MTTYYLFTAVTFILLSLSIAVEGIAITAPSANTIIQKGAIFTVSWSRLAVGVQQVSIDLYTGQSVAALQKVTNLGTASGSTGETSIVMPLTITDASNYFIRVADAAANGTEAATVGPLTIGVVSTSGVTSSSSAVTVTTAPIRPSTNPSVTMPSAISSESITNPSLTISNSQTSSNVVTRPSPAQNASTDDGGESLSIGAIVGIVVGGIAAIGALIFCTVMCIRRDSKDNRTYHWERKHAYNKGDAAALAASKIFSDPSHHTPMNKYSGRQKDLQQPYYSAPSHGAYYNTGYEDSRYYYGAPVETGGHNASTGQYNTYEYQTTAVYTPQVATGTFDTHQGQYNEYVTQQQWQYVTPTAPPATQPNPQSQNQPYYQPTQ